MTRSAHLTRVSSLVLLAVLCACVGSKKRALRAEGALEPPAIEAVLRVIDAEGLMRHVRTLSSDEFEGRAPGTAGEERTLAYLSAELAAAGVEPAAPDGSYFQRVPLVGITSRTEARFEVRGERLELSFPDELVASSRRFSERIDVERSPLVFAGYGVQAPEHGWDDFAGIDLTGKTLIVLVNDPPVRDESAEGDELDPAWFKGRAMTYYGRWTYKYEKASELGAAAVLIVHEDGPAGYGWPVVQGSFGREAFEIESEDGNAARVPVEGWIARAAAARLLAACGADLDELRARARVPGFRALELGGEASFRVRNTLRRVQSKNVVGRVTGSDPVLREEHVLFSAHWDHLGHDPSLEGDGIYNGAVDNASGTGGVLKLSEAFAALRTKPRRSLLFLFTTAEEKGLLGARWYAEHPLVPLERTLAVINLDGLNPWGRTHDVGVTGYGMTSLDELVIAAAVLQGRTVVPDQEPEKGYFYRSDHFELAKRGVPALDLDAGQDYVGRPPGWGRERRAEYLAERYHKPQDEIGPDWDLSGAVQDLVLAFRVALLVASDDAWPQWRPGTEFRALREESLRRSGALP